MDKWGIRFVALGGMVAALLATPALAAGPPRAANPAAKAKALVIKPLTLVKVDDLDFATLSVTTGGTAVIDPFSGAMTLSGGLAQVGGTVSRAKFAGAALKQTVVNIKVPNKPLLIKRVGGTETLTVSAFTLDGQDKRAMAAQTSFFFYVGATLTVPANVVEGVYQADMDVTVQYP